MASLDELTSEDHPLPEDLPEDPGESYRGRPPAVPGYDGNPDAIETCPRLVSQNAQGESRAEQVRIHHRYTLSRVLGTGAQGEVWQGTQEALKRTVAIKRLRAALPDDGEGAIRNEIDRIEHFRQEALVAASLEHPNIIPVHDLVTDVEGRPVLVMKEVRGKPWIEILNRTVRQEDPEFLEKQIPVLMAVTQAVAFAHSRGIIHRDLKPSQVMIGEFGEVLLTDWGLAMVIGPPEGEGSPSLARRGIWGYLVNPAGSPAYMAPEQTRSGLDGLGPWTDIFLLGGMLYYLLTGTPPYAARHSRAALLMARKCEIDPPEVRAPDLPIPRELSRLAMRALDPDPKRRVPSAADFHAALRDYMSGAGKRRESLVLTDQVRERCRDMAGYTELAASQAALARAEGLWSANPHVKGLRDELTLRFAELALSNGDLVLAEIQGEMLGDSQKSRELLEQVEQVRRRKIRSARERALALRGLGLFIVLFLALFAQYLRVEVRARDEAVMHRARTEEARKAAEAARARAEKASAAALTERNLTRRELYFSGLGYAAASIREGRVDKAMETLLTGLPQELRQMEWGHLLSRVTQDDMILTRGSSPSETIYRAELSPDGRRIVTAQRDGTVALWDTDRGQRIYERRLDLEKLWLARFSPDGRRLLVTSFNGEGCILDAQDGKVLTRLTVDGAPSCIMRGGDFSPDGARVAVTLSDNTVRVWDTATGTLESTFRFHGIPYDLDYTPDGACMAVALVTPGEAVLCDSRTGAVVRTFSGHEDVCYSVAVSPDGQKLVTTSRDRRIRVFNLHSSEAVQTFSWPENRPNQAVFSPDGALIAVATEGGACLFYDLRTGEMRGRADAAPEMYAICFDPAGRRFLTTSFSEVRLWSLDRALHTPLPEVAALPDGAEQERVRQVSFPLEREILWYGRDEAWMTSAPFILFQGPSGGYSVEPYGTVSSPDTTQRIELGYKPQPARVLDASGTVKTTLDSGGDVFNAAFSPTGRLAATGSYSGVMKIWDTSTWTEKGVLSTQSGAIWSLDFSPDEKLLAAGCHSGELVLWDVESGRLLFRISAHDAECPVVMARFSPDGTRLVTSSTDRTARVWDCRTGDAVTTMTGHAKALISGVFSPDGERVLTASFDGTAKLWDASTGRELLNMFSAHGGRYLMTAGFTRDGRRAFFTTDKRELFETEILPWREEELPGTGATPFEVRLELWKRQRRLNLESRLEDIAWRP